MITFTNSDIVRMYSETTGDSDVELSTAVPGCKTFNQAGIADSQEINYGIITYNLTTHRPVGMEVGTGKYNSSDSAGGPYLRRTSVISSILSSDSVEDVNIDLTGISEVYIPFLSKDVLTVQEADSDPAVYPVNKIIVSNGTLTNNGDGSVTITTGGSSSDTGGASYPAFASVCASTTPVDSVDNNITQTRLTINTESVDDTGIVSLDSDFNVVFADTGWFDVTVTLYYADATNFGNGVIYSWIDSDTAGGPPSWPISAIQTTSTSAKTDLYVTYGGPIEISATGKKLWITCQNVSGGTIQVGVMNVLIKKLGP